ncbi:MAG TPA: glycosyltransferase family 39 protein [Gemmatimonadales bacterium]|jgi:4-amino-4-deoxy-L-arabinose transferase-like glycosyltransferase|nr:glycosyltransferase family 39 protein [Gemmatimonadales bacterium]
MSLNQRESHWAPVAVMVLALVARLAVLPFGTSDGGDAPSRVWIGWEWLDHPRLLTYGVWGPLHTYLIALTLRIVPDPVHAPVAMSVLFSVASAGILYWFTRTEFDDPRAALLVGLTYAVYPIAIRNGVSVRAETPFVFFMLLSMIAVGRVRAGAASWRLAAAAGLSLTLASMLRYEAWVLIPIFGLLLRRQPRLLVTFMAFALLHPIFWSLGNWVHSGEPLYGFTAAARWELQGMGRAQMSRRLLAAEAAGYPGTVMEGMSLPIGLLCVGGAAVALVARHRSRGWLLAVAVVLALWCIGIARGALVPKVNYTEIAGTLLFPFSALAFQRLRIGQWRLERVVATAVALPLLSLLFSCKPCLARVRLGRLAGPSPIPRIENQETALALAATLGNELRAEESLVSDFYGWGATRYVALLTRLPRRRIFFAPGAPNQQLDTDSLAAFLAEHPHGVLIAASESRFTRLIGLNPEATHAAVGGASLDLVPMHRIGWQGPGHGTLMVFRYAVATDVGAGQRRERGLHQ